MNTSSLKAVRRTQGHLVKSLETLCCSIAWQHWIAAGKTLPPPDTYVS
jgi:hypothetical protein